MATPAPETLPSPRGAHLEMMAAVLAGEGLGRVAEIAARHAGSPVAVVVPRVGVPLEEWAPYERYVAARLAGGRPAPPDDITAEVPICSGPEEVGTVLLLGDGGADAGEYLHVAALAALTELAVVEAREDAERALRGSFLEELLSAPQLEPDTVEPIVRYDREYSSELVYTLETYLVQNCNMNATAATIYAHRHTIAYRLDRIRELTGFDPLKTEDRERLGLGLKAYRIIEPTLHR